MKVRIGTVLLRLLLALSIGLAASSHALAKPIVEGEQGASAGRPAPQHGAVQLCSTIVEEANRWALPASFFTRLIWQESRFNARAVSPKGAQGIAQFMPATARERGLADPYSPADALRASAHFLSELRASFGNLGLAAAAYNAGPKGIRDWLDGKRRLPAETEDYVLRITGMPAGQWTGAGDDYPPDAADATQACIELASSKAGLTSAAALKPVPEKAPDPFCARLAAIGAGCRAVGQ